MTDTAGGPTTDAALRRAIGVRRIGRVDIDSVQGDDAADGLRALLEPVLGALRVVSVRRIDLTPGTSVAATCRPTIQLSGTDGCLEVIVALTDADGHGGQLRVAARRPSSAAWRTPEDPVRPPRSMRTLPLGAGEAVLLDDGVIWCTYPNHTSEPTSFLVATVTSLSADLVVLRRSDVGLEAAPATDAQVHRAITGVGGPHHGWRRLELPPPGGARHKGRGLRSWAAAATPALDAGRHVVADPRTAFDEAVGRVRLRLHHTDEADPWSAAAAGLRSARDGGSIGERVAEGLLAAADAARPEDHPVEPAPQVIGELARAAGTLDAELASIEGAVTMPPVGDLTGIDRHDGGERRWTLADEGTWIDRSVERAPVACDLLRRRPGVIAASYVVLEGVGGPQPSDDVHGGVARLLVPLAHDDGAEAVVVHDRRHRLLTGPGRYLMVDLAVGSPGWRGWLSFAGQRTRPWRPRAHWTEHRLAQSASLGAAEEEPPEGVIVEDYDDFADGELALRSLVTRAGRRQLADKVSVPVIMTVVGLNNRLVDRHLRGTRAVWDPQEFPWTSEIEARWPEVRDEATALLASRQWVPTVREVVGIEAEADRPAVGAGHQWRNYILYHRGQWMDWNCQQCPRTTELVRSIPHLNFAFFSILEPHGHIVRHRGPNRGALRHHLGVLIPDPPESCTIQINGVDHHWYPGRTLMFDLTSEHEVWNTSDQPRVLLMCEVNTPLPPALAAVNRVTQAVYSAMPPFRRMKEHLRALEAPQRRS